MPVTPNGLVYTTAITIHQNQSITGSFIGCLSLSSGSNQAVPGDFIALKDLAGSNIVPPSTGHIYLYPGTTLNMNFTSASLHSSSAPVMFFVY